MTETPPGSTAQPTDPRSGHRRASQSEWPTSPEDRVEQVLEKLLNYLGLGASDRPSEQSPQEALLRLMEALIFAAAGIASGPALALQFAGKNSSFAGVLFLLVACFLCMLVALGIWWMVLRVSGERHFLRIVVDVLALAYLMTGASQAPSRAGELDRRPVDAAVSRLLRTPSLRETPSTQASLLVAVREATLAPATLPNVAVMLEQGADVNHIEGNEAPLQYATANASRDATDTGRLNLVRMLLQHGANPNSPTSALESAVDDAELFKLLLDHGADAGAAGIWRRLEPRSPEHIRKLTDMLEAIPSRPDWGPFCLAATKRSGPLIDYFAGRGIDPGTENCDGLPVMHVAAGAEPALRIELFRHLLAAGAVVDTRDALGRTELMRAAGSTEVVRYLLTVGANPNAVIAATGHSVLDLYLDAGWQPGVEIIEAAGGKSSRKQR